jgi:hypothetical protein
LYSFRRLNICIYIVKDLKTCCNTSLCYCFCYLCCSSWLSRYWWKHSTSHTWHSSHSR